MQKRQNYTSIAELMRGFLEEIEIIAYNDLPQCAEITRKLKKNNFFDKGISSNLLGCGSGQDQIIFAFYNKEKTIEEMLQSAMQGVVNEISILHVVFLAATVQDLMELEKKRTEIVKQAKKCAGSKKTSVRFYRIHAPEKEKPVFSIEITSRIRKLDHVSKDKAGVVIGADVYIAKLYDIVEMYSQIGAELFERNVRYHIKDVLNVESEIQKTLRSNPSEFFNLNNGIAMQIKDADWLDRRNEKDIRVKYQNCGDISIINGAQTIFAASEFFFKAPSSEVEGEAIKQAKETAFVLLRVFYPEEGPDRDCLAAFEKISISLNRQKPINPIDVQYSCPEVMQINALYERNRSNPFYFSLLKRGQGMSGLFQYQLSEFGRLVRAYYYNEPGQARAEPIQRIIQHPLPEGTNDEQQVKKSIYAPFKMDTDDEAVFVKWYKPINFANEIGNLYVQADRKYRNSEVVNENIRSILSNGRYFFVAYVVQSLNEQNTVESEPCGFKNFVYSAEDVKQKRDSIEKHILSFSELVAKFAEKFLGEQKNSRTTLDSNDFKKEDFYKAWCVFAMQDKEAIQWTKDLKCILQETPSDN